MAIGNRKRFEIFKRDSFKCQYCGKSAPDVILHVDHVDPTSNGGTDHPLNLITSCDVCNSGKSNILLSDTTAIDKQKKQLEELNERQQQLEMMLKWRSSLLKIDDSELRACSSAWSKIAIGWSWNKTGENSAKILIKKYGVKIVLDAIDAVSKYIQYESNDKGEKATIDSVEFANSKIRGTCYIMSLPEDKRKEYWELGKIKKMFQERYPSYDYTWDSKLINDFMKKHTIDELKIIANKYNRWWEIKAELKAACQ
jgi:hypothetical protein